MNTAILQDICRRSREYTGLVASLRTPQRGRYKPYAVSGLTEGAEALFLETLCTDFRDADDPTVIICADPKKAAAIRDLLAAAGLRASFYPAREYNFNNMTASHDFENERLSVLSALFGIATGAYEVESTP